ncbi:YraN family protein [Hydrocarboniclastica marina]|uniref:YraN family protein n=1 Tax=Hydrocarboniclastica marina TaxID=2259620 RepID=UPI001562C1FF|nr:YraN family protein [Hydrocarboniclastica marina]|tara:strand:+ start:538 stop:912 length:375 start_codon:yes stop_codon:yes gene_type:complete
MSRKIDRQKLGQDNEALAERYLLKQGMTIQARNYRCKAGEIDLIARHGDTLVFVEVRYRGNSSFASGEESVTRSKQRRLIRAAQHYLLYTRLDCPCRFDVLAINQTLLGRSRVHWIDNAFDASA